MNEIEKLLRHCSWANAIWIDFVYGRDRPDEFELKVMSHVLLGERAWLDRIANRDPHPEIWRILPDSELRQLNIEHRETFAVLLRGDIGRRVAYRRFSGEEYESPVADILLHIATHGAHHRGQLASHVSSRGIRPVNTDYIQYCVVEGL